MAAMHARGPVSRDEVVRVLSDRLGPMFRISSHFQTIHVHRRGLIPTRVRLSNRGDVATLTVRTSGMNPARLLHPSPMNPRVRAVLREHYVDDARAA